MSQKNNDRSSIKIKDQKIQFYLKRENIWFGDPLFGFGPSPAVLWPAIVKSSNLQRSFYDYTEDYEYNYDYDYETDEIFKKKRRKSKAPQEYDYNYDYNYDYDYATEDDYCFHCGADVTILPLIAFK